MLIEKQVTQLKKNTLKQLRVALTVFCSHHKIENAENKNLSENLLQG